MMEVQTSDAVQDTHCREASAAALPYMEKDDATWKECQQRLWRVFFVETLGDSARGLGFREVVVELQALRTESRLWLQSAP